jgi:hypothetical protein
MLYISKIENNELHIKIMETNNAHGLIIKIKIDKDTTNIFRNLYFNIHKNINFESTLSNVFIEYKDNNIRFVSDTFEYKINKNNEIIELIDKTVTNLMIYSLDVDSPKSKYDNFIM